MHDFRLGKAVKDRRGRAAVNGQRALPQPDSMSHWSRVQRAGLGRRSRSP